MSVERGSQYSSMSVSRTDPPLQQLHYVGPRSPAPFEVGPHERRLEFSSSVHKHGWQRVLLHVGREVHLGGQSSNELGLRVGASDGREVLI